MSRKKGADLAGKGCIFCGGETPATTWEHCPPVTLFRDKQRPSGYVFPACARCNNGSSQQDQIVAVFAMSTAEAFKRGTADRYWVRRLRGVANNARLALDYVDFNGGRAVIDKRGMVDLYELDTDSRFFSEWLNPWAAKLGCALYFEHSGEVIKRDQSITVRWQTDPRQMQDAYGEAIVNGLPSYKPVKQGSRDFSDQFSYRFAVNTNEQIGAFFVILQDFVSVLITVAPLSVAARYSHIVHYGESFSPDPIEGLKPRVMLPLANL